MSSATMNENWLHFRGLPVSLPGAAWWFDRLPLVVLLVSIAFLQGYSMRFWVGLLGTSGWGVSAGLEVLHLWFWFRAAVSVGLSRLAWLVLAVAATGLLLAGALHEVTRPLLRESVRMEAASDKRHSLEAEARLLQANLTAFLDMAARQGRRGWQDDIRRDTARLQIVTARLRNLTVNSGATARRPWVARVTQGGVIAVAVLFQVAAVLAVWSLASDGRNTEKTFRPDFATKTEPRAVSKTVARNGKTLRRHTGVPEQGFYRQLWEQIEAHAHSNTARLARPNGTISQAALARDLDIQAPDLSGIKNLALGQNVSRVPCRGSVATLAARFEIEMPK